MTLHTGVSGCGRDRFGLIRSPADAHGWNTDYFSAFESVM